MAVSPVDTARVALRTVSFQGRRAGRSAFALVNGHWSSGLAKSGRFRVTDYDPGQLSEVVIHHDFESRFADFGAPTESRAVAVRTWDFGPLPTAWAEKINREFHQFWAYSNWIAKQAEAGGVDGSRIRVVPLGVDPTVFRPDGPKYPLDDDRGFRFLFVGGVSSRKGTDILLDAYASAFTAADDVSLVIKDHSGDLFYRGDNVRGRIAAMTADLGAPKVVHIDEFLPEEDLASLYRACDVAVFPYRAEGFCLPILESMACGAPPIVPRFCACLDFCSDDVAFFTPARRIQLPVNARFKVALGFEEDVKEVDFCEVDRSALAARMREVAGASSDARRRMATAGAELARERFTWEASVARVTQCLDELAVS